MKVEIIKKNELNRIQKIAFETWPDTFKHILSKEQINYMIGWMYSLEMLSKNIDDGHLFFICSKDGHDIGFIGIQPLEINLFTLKIHKIYILPSFQRMGVGKKLMNKAVYMANIYKCKFLLLNVNRFNNAVLFYQKYGFEIIEEENIDIGNGFLMEDFVMRKLLI